MRENPWPEFDSRKKAYGDCDKAGKTSAVVAISEKTTRLSPGALHDKKRRKAGVFRMIEIELRVGSRMVHVMKRSFQGQMV